MADEEGGRGAGGALAHAGARTWARGGWLLDEQGFARVFVSRVACVPAPCVLR